MVSEILAEQQALEAERERDQAQDERERLSQIRRINLTPKQKSDLINKIGLDAYRTLPFYDDDRLSRGASARARGSRPRLRPGMAVGLDHGQPLLELAQAIVDAQTLVDLREHVQDVGGLGGVLPRQVASHGGSVDDGHFGADRAKGAQADFPATAEPLSSQPTCPDGPRTRPFLDLFGPLVQRVGGRDQPFWLPWRC
jgi:hypothetical protein